MAGSWTNLKDTTAFSSFLVCKNRSRSGVCFTKVFRTELGHKYILVECSVIALCLPVMSKLPVINPCAINRTMIGMSIKRISVLNLCHVLKPFVKSTPALVRVLLSNNSLFVGHLWADKSLVLHACGSFSFTTDLQTVNYYSTIHY